MSSADSHLTYIGSLDRAPGHTLWEVLDVYPRGGGAQLGYGVARRRSASRREWCPYTLTWQPLSGAWYRTRWEAATDAWGTAS